MNKKIIWIFGAVMVTGILGFTVYQTNATSSDPDLSIEEITELIEAQYPSGEHSEPELQMENGNPVYQLEVTVHQAVYALKLNGDTGQVIDLQAVESSPNKVHKEDNQKTEIDQEQQERKEEQEKQQSAQENDSILSHTEAKEIALEEFPGQVMQLELDEDNDTLIYEIEIVNNDQEASIEINAYTGNIIVIEIDD